MSKSRRQLLNRASIGLLATASACRKAEQKTGELPPGAPPAFGTAPVVGPEVSSATFAAAEKLMQVELTAPEREMAAGNWRKRWQRCTSAAPAPESIRRPRTAPATRWDPVLPGLPVRRRGTDSSAASAAAGPLPASDEDIAFAPVAGSRVGSKRGSSLRNA